MGRRFLSPVAVRDPDARSAIVSANLPPIPGTSAPCIRSIRTARNAGQLFRAWWSSRSDSSVVLSMQGSPDGGGTWQPPVEVEPRDRGRRGCDRPPPGISYDATSGYVHLVYFIEASDGAGVFFAHSMDKGRMFHSPVPVVYGSSPSVARVADMETASSSYSRIQIPLRPGSESCSRTRRDTFSISAGK